MCLVGIFYEFAIFGISWPSTYVFYIYVNLNEFTSINFRIFPELFSFTHGTMCIWDMSTLYHWLLGSRTFISYTINHLYWIVSISFDTSITLPLSLSSELFSYWMLWLENFHLALYYNIYLFIYLFIVSAFSFVIGMFPFMPFILAIILYLNPHLLSLTSWLSQGCF